MSYVAKKLVLLVPTTCTTAQTYRRGVGLQQTRFVCMNYPFDVDQDFRPELQGLVISPQDCSVCGLWWFHPDSPMNILFFILPGPLPLIFLLRTNRGSKRATW